MSNPEHTHGHAQSRDIHSHETLHVEHGAHVTVLKLGEQTERALSQLIVWLVPTLIGFMLIIAACGVIMGLNLSKQNQMDRDFRDLTTSNKLLERRNMDMEAYAMLNGWKIPSDDTHGPTGNLERMRPQKGK